MTRIDVDREVNECGYDDEKDGYRSAPVSPRSLLASDPRLVAGSTRRDCSTYMIPAMMTGMTDRIMRSGRRMAMAVIPTCCHTTEKSERARARWKEGATEGDRA